MSHGIQHSPQQFCQSCKKKLKTVFITATVKTSLSTGQEHPKNKLQNRKTLREQSMPRTAKVVPQQIDATRFRDAHQVLLIPISVVAPFPPTTIPTTRTSARNPNALRLLPHSSRPTSSSPSLGFDTFSTAFAVAASTAPARHLIVDAADIHAPSVHTGGTQRRTGRPRRTRPSLARRQPGTNVDDMNRPFDSGREK